MLNNWGWSSMLTMRRKPGWYWTDLAIERCTSCASQRGHSQRRHSSQSDRRSSKGPLMVAEFYSIQWIQWFLSNGSIISINSSPKNTLDVSADYSEFVCLFVCLFVVDFISIVVGWSHFAGAQIAQIISFGPSSGALAAFSRGPGGTGQVFGRLTLDGPATVTWRLAPLSGLARASSEHFLGNMDWLWGQAMEEGSRYMVFDRFGFRWFRGHSKGWYTCSGHVESCSDYLQVVTNGLSSQRASDLGMVVTPHPSSFGKAELFSSLEFEQVKKTWFQNRSFPGAPNTAVLEESLETA